MSNNSSKYTVLIYSKELSQALRKIDGEKRYLRKRADAYYYFDENELLSIDYSNNSHYKSMNYHKRVCFYNTEKQEENYLSPLIIARTMTKLSPYISTLKDFINIYNEIYEKEEKKNEELESMGQIKIVTTEVYECSLCGKQYFLNQKAECENHVRNCGKISEARKRIEIANKKWKEGCSLAEINKEYPFFKELPGEIGEWTKDTLLKEKTRLKKGYRGHCGHQAVKIINLKADRVIMRGRHEIRVSPGVLKTDFYKIKELQCPYCEKQFSTTNIDEYNKHYFICEKNILHY